MFLSTFHATRRRIAFAIALQVFVLIAHPFEASGQGISVAGIGEGSVLVLPVSGARTNLSITATPASPAGATNMVFVLERQGLAIFNRTSPPPYAATFTNLAVGKYFLSATLANGGIKPAGDVSFDIVVASAAPANDNWGQAAVLPGLNQTVTNFNTYATSETNEPVHAGLGVGKSVWWLWNAGSNGFYTVTTAGSAFDTVVGVYTGTNLSTLVAVGANDDAGPNAFSQATFYATNGTTYYFAVDGASAYAYGETRLRLVAGSPPAISITSPVDGSLRLVASPATPTNAQAAAAITDPAGVARVDYWFDSSSGFNRSGSLSSPYQLGLTNLTEGHYTLTLAASNSLGLISVANAGFSVISLAPVLVTEGFLFSSNRFQLGVTGFKGPNYSLQASSNLDVWCSLKTFTNFAGAEKLTDTNSASFNKRFYRASATQ